MDVVLHIAALVKKTDASCGTIRNLARATRVPWDALARATLDVEVDNSEAAFMRACVRARQEQAFQASVRRAHVPHVRWLRVGTILRDPGHGFFRVEGVEADGVDVRAVVPSRTEPLDVRAKPNAPKVHVRPRRRTLPDRRRQELRFRNQDLSLAVWRPPP